ncbi:MAG: glycosyltransferase family 2 protein [Lachnospiraceae bacterium]|nr:glycosyltransferase family 2 protein [Lachnospiraceae bacterium]
MGQALTLYVVLPCFNEEEVLPETARRLKDKMQGLMGEGILREDSRICFINDGSSDGTWSVISALHEKDSLFSGISLSGNRGHQNALLAGLMTVYPYADAVISMDADLQDDMDAIDLMLEKYASGVDVVYGVRSDRNTDSFFKRFTAHSFYKLMQGMGVKTVYDHADFRLMSQRAVKALSEYQEVNLFLRGLIPLVGFSSDVVYYERKERFAGSSKYPLKKMIAFALEGITSFSVQPIRLITGMGVFIFLISICIMIYSVVRHARGETVPGWTYLNVSVWAIGGLILLSLGVIGEYIGKIYLETKRRPRYTVEQFLDRDHGFLS